MKTTLSIRLQIATWIIATIFTLVPLFNGRPMEHFIGTVLATLFWMGVYYFFFFYMTTVFLLPKNLIGFFGISIALLLFLPLIGYSMLFFSKALFRGDFTDFYKGYSLSMHFNGFKALVLAGLYGSFFRLITEYFKKP